ACVQAAATRYNLSLTECFISNRNPGSPATYQTWDVIAGAGVNFILNIDRAYWLYVNVTIPLVFVQSNELVAAGDPAMGIAAGGINTVDLDNGWTMVNSALNATSREWGFGTYAPWMLDIDSNNGTAASGTIFYTAGDFVVGTYMNWYDAPLGSGVYYPVHENDAQGAGAGAGYVNSAIGPLLKCANTWNSTARVYNTGVAYDDGFGQWRFGSAYNNVGSPIYYASGFWVYAYAAGAVQYDING
ncbi:MAG: hypothetical protein AB1665_07880, partial [Candidatus Thermoplasmatota archaeon]